MDHSHDVYQPINMYVNPRPGDSYASLSEDIDDNPFLLSSDTHSHNHSYCDTSSHSHSHDDTRSINTTMSPGYNPSAHEIRQFYHIDPAMDLDESSYLLRTILSFKYYQRNTTLMNHARMQSFYALPSRHRDSLQPGFTQKLEGIDMAIEKNAELARMIARVGEEMYLGGKEVKMGGPLTPLNKDMSKARSTLKQFVRDWSEEGAEERRLCYGPILEALNILYGNLTAEEKAKIRVLVPGAGLGRIVYEILCAGYEVQGNELEFCMLMASNVALNHLSPEDPIELHPYIHTTSHHRSTEDMLRGISIPDINTSAGILSSGTKGSMSYVAGDFSECYSSDSDSGTFSVVVTTFFIDTAANILKYLDTISHVLKQDGIWINLGPLAWHFEPEDSSPAREGGTVELTLSELITLIERSGFDFVRGEEGLDRRSIKMPYMANGRGMLTYMYECEFWVARKR